MWTRHWHIVDWIQIHFLQYFTICLVIFVHDGWISLKHWYMRSTYWWLQHWLLDSFSVGWASFGDMDGFIAVEPFIIQLFLGLLDLCLLCKLQSWTFLCNVSNKQQHNDNEFLYNLIWLILYLLVIATFVVYINFLESLGLF